MIDIKLLTILSEDDTVYTTDTTRWTGRHGEQAVGLDSGLLARCDVPRLFDQLDRRICRILNLCEADSAECRRIVTEVRRILG